MPLPPQLLHNPVPLHSGHVTGTFGTRHLAKAAPIYEPGERVAGAMSVVSRYLRTAYLWDAVRVQGGAYGCNLGFSRFTGLATFSSYRDPNVASTLTNYDGTAAFLRANPLGPAELSRAIIGAVGELDAPQSVDGRGYTAMVRHLLGITEGERQQWRDEVLGTTPADFLEFGERIEQVVKSGSVAAVASERAIAEANEALPEGKVKQLKQTFGLFDKDQDQSINAKDLTTFMKSFNGRAPRVGGVASRPSRPEAAR